LRNTAYAAAFLVLCAGTLLAQQANNGNGNGNSVVDPTKFWQAPAETDRDSKGNITYTEIKDPKSFTKRVFANGQWATYHYRPGTVELTSIDNSDSTEELLYDGTRNFKGVTVHADGKSHTLRYDRSNGTVAAGNLATVTVERDPTSTATRDLIVRSGRQVVASVDYNAAGEVASINVGSMTLSLMPAGNVIKETLKANGATIKEATATMAVRRTFTVLLDPVAERLHIGKEWANETRSRATQTGYLNTLQQGTSVLARIVRVGEMQAGFAADGTALFYDVTLDYGAGGNAQRSDYKVAAMYAAALPTHIIVTSDGKVGAYVETPGSGCIRVFWTSHSAGHAQYNYSVYDSGRPSARNGAASTVAPTSAGSVQPQRSTALLRVVSPRAMMMCDSSEVCTDGGTGCPTSGGCSTTYYYCDTGGGGGGVSPLSDGGSGGGPSGGGSQSPGNHIYDPQIHMAVGRAISAANDKLSDPNCGVELLKNATWDGTSAFEALTSRGGGESAKDWFGGISWLDGEGRRDDYNQTPCNTASAWTTPRQYHRLRMPALHDCSFSWRQTHT
jgi:hypothetical protein